MNCMDVWYFGTNRCMLTMFVLMRRVYGRLIGVRVKEILKLCIIKRI